MINALTPGMQASSDKNCDPNPAAQADVSSAMAEQLPAGPTLSQTAPLAAYTLPHTLPIFLVGMMGAGKTTIGKSLARALQRDFIDLDHELEARCGVKIPVIFEIEGESGFRKRERQVLNECTVRPGIVLATGGGAVLASENRQALRGRGIVVYLRATVEELFRRTSRDRNRPLLATADPKNTLRNLLEMREPLYQEVADLIMDTGTVSVGVLVGQLIEQLKKVDKTLDPRDQEFTHQVFAPFIQPQPTAAADTTKENQS
jgi:shikimate kinase